LSEYALLEASLHGDEVYSSFEADIFNAWSQASPTMQPRQMNRLKALEKISSMAAAY
jgi:hypothetical protein